MDTAQKRKKIDRQFKIDAVNLVVNGQRKVSDVARDLGIEANMLHRWRRELRKAGAESFPGKGRLGPQEEELVVGTWVH